MINYIMPGVFWIRPKDIVLLIFSTTFNNTRETAQSKVQALLSMLFLNVHKVKFTKYHYQHNLIIITKDKS